KTRARAGRGDQPAGAGDRRAGACGEHAGRGHLLAGRSAAERRAAPALRAMSVPNKPFSLAAALAAAACALACNQEPDDGLQEAFYDRPHTIPAGVPYTGTDKAPDSQPVASAEECGRGRGIDAEGNCVQVGLRDLEFGGMV